MLKTKRIIFILMVLSSVSFFNPFNIISPYIQKLLIYIVFSFAILYSLIYGDKISVPYPRKSYLMLIIGILVSMFMASMFHPQDIGSSFITTLPCILGFLSFYVLMRLNIPKSTIENLIWRFCFIGMLIYIVNIATFPNMIFAEHKDEYDFSRGSLRIGIVFFDFIVLFFFYSINQWLVYKKKKYVFLIILTGTYILLSLTRQSIFLSGVLAIIFLFKKFSLPKKFLLIIVSILLFGYVLPHIPLYKTLTEMTKDEMAESRAGEENIRIRAWRFYTYQNQTNILTPFLGNGIPSMGRSEWGNQFRATISKEQGGNACYAADVGWAGFFWYFGLFATLGLLSLMFYAILKPKKNDKKYLSYWCIYIVLTSVASGPIIYFNQIFIIMIVLYLIYGKETSNRDNYSELQ